MLKRVFGTVTLALLAFAVCQAQMVLNMGTKDGDTISGEKDFRVTVQSQSRVSQVEFYVNDNLVFTDDSTPYELKLDTLNYNDGPLKVTIAAYNAAGESKKVTLTLKVDNGLALGVKHHVDIADKDLVNQKWDDAIAALRVALKIDAKDNTARMAMARAYFGKGVYDLAEKYVRDVMESDPANLDAQNLLAGISLRTAFKAIGGADRDHTIDTISEAFKTASQVRRGALMDRVAKFGTVTDDNRMAYIDLMNEAGRYSLSIDQLSAMFGKDESDPEVADRLLYAQVRAGRFVDAQVTLTKHLRRGEPDAYGYAIKSIIDDWFGDQRGSM
ncbi:MAG TPA: tetratricopeptide repeat protein, partial [Fimbriimonadaceae bacterium]|nr:tetratricopeptide repeat protein [Fimbriimonadaceae bacterium]